MTFRSAKFGALVLTFALVAILAASRASCAGLAG